MGLSKALSVCDGKIMRLLDETFGRITISVLESILDQHVVSLFSINYIDIRFLQHKGVSSP